VPLSGDGLTVREWLHVDDHCRAVQLVASNGRPGEIYNVGGGEELTNRELVTRLLALLGRDSDQVETVVDRKGHDRRYSLDSSKAAADLGFEARIDFATGLEQTVAWYMSNRDWWEPLKQAARASA
jgi:dTDP-glucose 4,6-dehydratase